MHLFYTKTQQRLQIGNLKSLLLILYFKFVDSTFFFLNLPEPANQMHAIFKHSRLPKYYYYHHLHIIIIIIYIITTLL